ncbi:MAG TPA: hypothetical protein VGG39_26175 [Polyangiaceae bacterium]|jgi:hypothetical protein
MTAVAIEPTKTNSSALQRFAAFPLAGMALFGLVLEEDDVSHDNAQGFIVLGCGVLAGLIVGAWVGRRPSIRESAARIAWDAVRFVLAYEMIRYGVPKLIGMQFYPQYFRRDKRVIDLASSSLTWEFLGRTYWYQAFGGLIEVGSGVLICFRRTTLLGACLMTTALLNVVLINFFYDVDVKLFASVYLLFDLALIAPHWRRLQAFFLAPVEPISLGRRGRWLYGLTVTLAIVAPTVKMLREGIEHRVFEREPLEGAWSVKESTGATAAWDRIYFEKDDVGFIRVGGRFVPFHKELEGGQLRLSIAEDDRLAHVGHALTTVAAAGAEAFPQTVRGSLTLEAQRARFDGQCDGQPCAMTLTREFPK